MRVVSFKIDEDLLFMLEQVARKKKLTKSELIRIAIRQYLLENNKKKIIVTKRIRIYY